MWLGQAVSQAFLLPRHMCCAVQPHFATLIIASGRTFLWVDRQLRQLSFHSRGIWTHIGRFLLVVPAISDWEAASWITAHLVSQLTTHWSQNNNFSDLRFSNNLTYQIRISIAPLFLLPRWWSPSNEEAEANIPVTFNLRLPTSPKWLPKTPKPPIPSQPQAL